MYNNKCIYHLQVPSALYCLTLSTISRGRVKINDKT